MSNGTGGLWARLQSAFERTDIGVAGAAREGAGEEDAVRPTATRYAPLREAIERRINAFLREDLVSHLEIGFNEIFLLHYIEIVADSQGAPELAQFLHEFSPESRVRWIRKLLGGAVGQQHISVDQFLGVDREFTAEQLAETDPFEEKLNQAARPLYRVILHGRWEVAPSRGRASAAMDPVHATEPSPPAGPCLLLSVRDARMPGNEAWTVEVDHFPAVLGSSVQADVELSGYFVSARHCTLHWDGQQISLTDHSTNGTWVDGKRVRRSAHIALANGALLGFGRDPGESDYERYPAVRVQIVHTVLAEAVCTPVWPSRPTPVAPGIIAASSEPPARKAALAVLAIADANGNVRRDVIRLPFTIGRGSAQDYTVPEANEGVSREHLVIEDIGRGGAITLNRAASRNGTFAGTQALPERFVWGFGQEIALGEKWTGAPAVRVLLQAVGEAL